MEELLALARQLRPAVLDDHGLLPALHSQVRDFSDQTGIQAAFNVRGQAPQLTPEQQLVVYRVDPGEPVERRPALGRRRGSTSSCRSSAARCCGSPTTATGSSSRRDGGLGLSGMRERALLVGGHLSIWSGKGQGTRVELTLA